MNCVEPDIIVTASKALETLSATTTLDDASQRHAKRLSCVFPTVHEILNMAYLQQLHDAYLLHLRDSHSVSVVVTSKVVEQQR